MRVRIAAVAALIALSACGRSDRVRPEPQKEGLRITPRVLPAAVLGQPYQVRLLASRSRGRVGWRMLGPRPSWMQTSLEGDGNKEFVMSGVPDSAGSFEIALEAIDSAFQSDRMSSPLIVITDGSPPEIVNQRLPVGFVGVSYRVALSARGGLAPYTFTARDLPIPLRVSDGDVQYIEGVPSSSTMRAVFVTVMDAEGAIDERSFDLEIQNPQQIFEIINLSVPTGDVDASYAASAEVNRGEAAWSISGNLPQGLVIDVSEGPQLRIGGTPIEVGRFDIDIEARLADGLSAQARATIVIRNSMVDPLELRPTTILDGVVGVPYRQEIRAVGGVEPIEWRTKVGPFPLGIRGVAVGRSFIIEGTPTEVGPNAFRVIVTGAQGAFAEVLYHLDVTGQPFTFLTRPELPPAEKSRPYRTTIEVSGGVAPYTYSVTSGALPSGLQLEPSSASTVDISGTPDTLGMNSIAVRVQDARRNSRIGHFTLQVLPLAPNLQITVPPISAEACGPVSEEINVSGGLPTPAIWSLGIGQHGLRIRSRTDSGAEIYGHYRPVAGPVIVTADRGSQRISAPINVGVTSTTTQPRYSAVIAGTGAQRSLHLVDICGSGSPEITLVSNGLGAGNSVKFSPDGRWLAYLAGPMDQLSLWGLRLDGAWPGVAQELGQTGGPGRTVRSFEWSPNSRLIAYEGDVLVNTRFEGFTVRLGATPLFSRLHGPVLGLGVSPGGLGWSPDSRYVLLRGDFETPNVDELFVVSPDSGGADFTQIVDITVPGGKVLAFPKWNPDGASIMYAAEAEAAGRRDLYLLPMNGALPGLPIHVTAFMVAGGDISVPNYDWSSNGLHGHFLADYRVDGRVELFSWRGQNPPPLLSALPNLAPSEQVQRAIWSAPGTGLAIVVSDINVTESKLHVLDAPGPGQSALRTPVFSDPQTGVDRARLHWSPDGEWLGVVARNGTSREARLVRRTGGVLRPSTQFDPGNNARIVFLGGQSVDTKAFVVGVSSGSNIDELHIIDAQNFRNGVPRRIGRGPSSAGPVAGDSAEHFAVRPEATGLVFLRDFNGLRSAHLVDTHPSPVVEAVSLNGGSLRNQYVSEVIIQPRN